MTRITAAAGLTVPLLVRRFLADYARNPVNLLMLVLVPAAFVAAAARQPAAGADQPRRPQDPPEAGPRGFTGEYYVAVLPLRAATERRRPPPESYVRAPQATWEADWSVTEPRRTRRR